MVLKSPADDTSTFTASVTSHSLLPSPSPHRPCLTDGSVAIFPCALALRFRLCLRRYAIHTAVLGCVMTVPEAWRIHAVYMSVEGYAPRVPCHGHVVHMAVS